MQLHFNFAIKDAIGGWKENGHVIKLAKACMSLKSIMNNSWKPFLNLLGVKDPNCPIAQVFLLIINLIYLL